MRPGQNIFRPGRFATESTFDEVVKTNGVCPDNAVLKLGADLRVSFRYLIQKVARNGFVSLTVARGGKLVKVKDWFQGNRPMIQKHLAADASKS